MKKFLILLIAVLIATPVFAFSFDKKGHLKFGKSVNIEVVPPYNNDFVVQHRVYFSDLESVMENSWRPPIHIKSSRTVYTFEINPEKKTINHINLLRTSGFEDVDRSAMATLRQDVIFKNFPDEKYDENIVFKATFIRSVLGRPEVQNNDTVIVMTQNCKKALAKSMKAPFQKQFGKKYIEQITKELKRDFILSDHPAMFMSVFKFDILKDGSVDNVVVTTTSGVRNLNEDVIKKLSGTQFEPLPPILLKDKITLEYKISNHIKKPSKK